MLCKVFLALSTDIDWIPFFTFSCNYKITLRFCLIWWSYTQYQITRVVRTEGTMIRPKYNQILGTKHLKIPKTYQWTSAQSQRNNGRERKTWQKPQLEFYWKSVDWIKSWQFTHTLDPTRLSWSSLAKMKSQSSCIQDKEVSKSWLV